MNAASVDWIPAVVTLAVGLATGVLVYARARSRAAAVPAKAPTTVHAEDLAAKRDALVQQLREMEDTGSKRTAAQLARERYELELDAAHVLLALDAATVATGRKRSSPKTAPPPRAASAFTGVRGFLWGVGTATALLLLGFFVYQSAKPRESGGSVTGELPARGATSEGEAEIEAAIARNPSDVSAHIALAQAKLERRDLMGVWNEAGRILELSPGNTKGLALQAFVRIAMGQPAMAVDILRKVIATEPDFIDAHAWLALAYVRLGRKGDADAAVAAASRRFPDRADEFRRFLADIERDPGGDAVASDDANPHSGTAAAGAEAGPMARSTAQPRPAAAKSSRRHVAGTIELDPALAGKVSPRAVLFVFVRPAGVAAGPPTAVKRLAPVFPLSFDLGEEDAMMGQPFPDPLLVEARLDEDGDPTTRPPTDPKARVDGIKAGTTGVKLVLKRQ
ncbi:MAG: tetratricopeptide repeat protein [Myxococcales bacterium]